MTREGTLIWSNFIESIDNMIVTDSFEGSINEEENKIIGKSIFSTSEDGFIFEFDIVITKIKD